MTFYFLAMFITAFYFAKLALVQEANIVKKINSKLSK